MIALAAVMMYNVQMFTAENTPISLFAVKNMAIAQGEQDCDLCVVTRGEEVKFSCKPMANESCSASAWGTTLYCNNAKECS